MSTPEDQSDLEAATACKRLWLSVLAQALRDAITIPASRTWIDTEDFDYVCVLAGLEPEFVRRRAQALTREADAGDPMEVARRLSWINNTGQLGEGGKRKSTAAVMIEHNGKSQSISAWAKEAGIPASTLNGRLALGWSMERAMTEPVTRSSNRMIEFNGKCQSIAAWARELGMRPDTLFRRIEAGWPIARAFSKPKRTYGGQVENFKEALGAGAGSDAQDRANLEFSHSEAGPHVSDHG